MIIFLLALVAVPEADPPALPSEVEWCQEAAPYDVRQCVEAIQSMAGRNGIFTCEVRIIDKNPKVICSDPRSQGKSGPEKAPR